MHAFISSRIDYCNALYVGLDQDTLQHLQREQNAAAQLLTNSHKHDHITPFLCSLHWLPVWFRIDFKLLMFVFKAIHGLALSYLCELLTTHTIQDFAVCQSGPAGGPQDQEQTVERSCICCGWA